MKVHWATIWQQWREYIVFSVVFIMYFITRVWVYIAYGQRAFGYDTGIYRHYIKGYFERMGDPTLAPFGFAYFSNSLQLIGMSVETIMFPVYIAIAVGIAILFYVLVRATAGWRVAVIALLLLTISTLQFDFYAAYYYRNLLGIFLALSVMYLSVKRSWLAVLPAIALVVIHPVTALPVTVGLMVWALWGGPKRYIIFLGLVTLLGSVFVYAEPLLEYWRTFVAHGGRVGGTAPEEWSGQFMTVRSFILHRLYIIILAGIGMWRYAKRERLWMSVIAACVAIVATQLLFYRRSMVLLDLALIVFAAYVIRDMLCWVAPRARGTVIGLGAGVVAVVFALYIHAYQPLVSASEFFVIQDMARWLPADAQVLVTSAYYAPWVYGYSERAVIAPGLFEYNRWDENRWDVFWHTQDSRVRAALLQSYTGAGPVYVFTGARAQQVDTFLQKDAAFVHEDLYVWRWQYEL